jgi:transposase-like protein
MTRAVRRDPIYRHRRSPSEVIETCVRWFITYRLSYRDLVAMMAERDVVVFHTTIRRWGGAVRTGVREALDTVRQAREFLLADG